MPRSGRRWGGAGLVAYGLVMMGFTGIAGFLFADAAVLPQLPTETTEAILSGPAGMAIFGAVILYVAGTLAFTGTAFAARALPRPALALWGLGTLPTVAAIALPAAVMTVAEILVSIGILWVAAHIWRGLG